MVEWGCQPKYFVYTQILLAVQGRFFGPQWVTKSAVRRYSLSLESPCGSGGISSKIRHWPVLPQNGKHLGHVGVKGEIGHWVVNAGGSKEASVVKTE